MHIIFVFKYTMGLLIFMLFCIYSKFYLFTFLHQMTSKMFLITLKLHLLITWSFQQDLDFWKALVGDELLATSTLAALMGSCCMLPKKSPKS